MYPLGATYNEPSGYSPSVLDPTLMAPSGGAYSGGTPYGGGISFYGTGATGGYTAPTSFTIGVSRPPTTTATSPYYGGTATASPAPFPAAPGTPGGSVSESPPALNPLAAAGGATGIGAPRHASPAPMQSLNNNPYAASLRAYTAPVSPLAGIRAADQSHGGPTLQGGAQQAITSNGMDNTPVGVPHFGVAGAGGLHGGMGNMPPTQAPAPPLSHVPFSAMVAYNGNGGNQGAGTANRDNLQAQSPTRGQGLQQSPPPPLFKPPPKNVMVPPPQPVAVPLGNPAVAAGMPADVLATDPNIARLDNTMQALIQFMVGGINRSIVNADKFQEWVQKGYDKMDQACVRFVASQIVGPQKEVDMYEKPGATGLSLLEQADEIMKDAVDARARQQEIHAHVHDAHYQSQARLYVQDALDTNAKYANGPFPEIQESRRNEIKQGMAKLASMYKAADMKAENDRETDALKKSYDILNGYHAALVNRAAAQEKATEIVEKRKAAFWKMVDETRASESNLNSNIQGYLKTYIDGLQRADTDAYRTATVKLQEKANDLNGDLKAQNIQNTRLHSLEGVRTNLQKELDALNTKKVPSSNKAAVEDQKIQLQKRIDLVNKKLELMGGI